MSFDNLSEEIAEEFSGLQRAEYFHDGYLFFSRRFESIDQFRIRCNTKVQFFREWRKTNPPPKQKPPKLTRCFKCVGCESRRR